MALGQQMADRKAQLKEQFAAQGLPTPVTRTLSGAKVDYGQPQA